MFSRPIKSWLRHVTEATNRPVSTPQSNPSNLTWDASTDKCRVAEMPFIFTDSLGKTEPAKRKLIRKHVMLGKNRGKSRKVKPVKTENPSTSGSSNGGYDDGTPGLSIKLRYSLIPNRVGSDLSFTHFAVAVEPPLLHDLLRCKRLLHCQALTPQFDHPLLTRISHLHCKIGRASCRERV